MILRPYSKTELAMAYAPELSISGALHRFQRWIEMQPELMNALHSAGYTKLQRIFSVKQVRLIFEYLGEP